MHIPNIHIDRMCTHHTHTKPIGWWHAAINTRGSVALTHNLCLAEDVHDCLRQLREESPELAHRWEVQLRKHRPELLVAEE